MLMGHILGFGEDELGEPSTPSSLGLATVVSARRVKTIEKNNFILYARFKCVQTMTQMCVEIA